MGISAGQTDSPFDILPSKGSRRRCFFLNRRERGRICLGREMSLAPVDARPDEVIFRLAAGASEIIRSWSQRGKACFA